MRHPVRRRVRVALLAALLAGPALASPAASEARTPADAADLEDWRERIADARADVGRAHQRRDAAESAVDRMRHRRYPRGEAREALFEEREAARQAVAEAERALEETLEEARRAGVPPGWLRAPAPQPAAAPE